MGRPIVIALTSFGGQRHDHDDVPQDNGRVEGINDPKAFPRKLSVQLAGVIAPISAMPPSAKAKQGDIWCRERRDIGELSAGVETTKGKCKCRSPSRPTHRSAKREARSIAESSWKTRDKDGGLIQEKADGEKQQQTKKRFPGIGEPPCQSRQRT